MTFKEDFIAGLKSVTWRPDWHAMAKQAYMTSGNPHYTIYIADTHKETFRSIETSIHDFREWLADNVPTATLEEYTINCASDADAALIKLFWQDGN